LKLRGKLGLPIDCGVVFLEAQPPQDAVLFAKRTGCPEPREGVLPKDNPTINRKIPAPTSEQKHQKKDVRNELKFKGVLKIEKPTGWMASSLKGNIDFSLVNLYEEFERGFVFDFVYDFWVRDHKRVS
jgi:hypothetical protein